MPEYQHEALDASGKSVTGTISCRDEQQALEALDKSGLHPTKLTLREETPKAPASKYWDGTFGDAVQWFFCGVCLPVAGIVGGLLNPEKVHPAVSIIVAAGIGLVMIAIRLRTGKWPEGGESSG